jgi:hypothetical protein
MKHNTTKTYTVSVTVEASCQLEIKASSVKEAKAKAEKLAGELIQIEFDGECRSPQAEVMPIYDDAVEED